MPDPTADSPKPADNEVPPTQVLRHVWAIAWPVVVASLIDATEGLVDIYFVGFLGPAAISAIGMSRQIVFIVMVMAISITGGTRTLVAQYYGAGRHGDVSRTGQQAILMGTYMALGLAAVSIVLTRPALVLLGAPEEVLTHGMLFLRLYFAGMIFMILNYVMSAIFGGVGDTRTPLKISVIVIIVKCVTSYAFIFGAWVVPALGVAGAAVGMIISRLAGCVIGLAILVRGNGQVRLSRNWRFKPDRNIMSRMLDIGLPSGASGFFRNGARVLLYRVISGVSRPTAAIAALTVGFQIRLFAIMPALAFSVAANSLVGQRLGGRQIRSAEQYGGQTILLCMIVIGAGSALIWIFAQGIASVFTTDETVLGISSVMLRFFAIAQIFSALSIVASGVLAGGGETRPSLYYTLFSQWGIMLVFSYVLAFPLGLDVTGIWIAWLAAAVLQGLLTLRRFFKGTWKRAVV